MEGCIDWGGAWRSTPQLSKPMLSMNNNNNNDDNSKLDATFWFPKLRWVLFSVLPLLLQPLTHQQAALYTTSSELILSPDEVLISLAVLSTLCYTHKCWNFILQKRLYPVGEEVQGVQSLFGDSRETAKIFVEGESNIMESLSFRREKDLQSAFIKPLLCARQADILHNYLSPQKNSSMSIECFLPF